MSEFSKDSSDLHIPQDVKDSLAERGLLPPMWYVGGLEEGEPKGQRPPAPKRPGGPGRQQSQPYPECATWLVNRIEGKSADELKNTDLELFKNSLESEGDTGAVIACQVGGCTVAWALNKDAEGKITRDTVIGLPLCS